MAKAVKKTTKKVTKKTIKAPSKTDMAKAKVEKELKLLRKKFEDAEKKARAHIHKNPEKAAMIAGAVGVAIGAGLAIALKKKSKK